uniref:Uncharacterized protein n=1 Tax=Glossina brevipalpis TaxID=37001 RepID=A0A1A9WMP5_9MUSC
MHVVIIGMAPEYFVKSKGEGREECTNMPLHALLWEWALHNISVPDDLTTAVVYVLLFVFAWYGVSLVARFIVAVVWPLLLIASAVFPLRLSCQFVLKGIQFYESEDFHAAFHTGVKVVADTLVKFLAGTLETILGFVD